MTALSADSLREHKAQGKTYGPVAASTVIYKGSLVARNSSGYLVPASDASGIKVLGVNIGPKVDNSSGSNGDLYADYVQSVQAPFACSGATQTWVGEIAYVTDDNTVTITPNTYGVIAGKVVQYESATKVWVDVMPAYDGITFDKPLTYISLDLTTFRRADMAAMGIAEEAGDHYLAESSGAIVLKGVAAQSNTKTDVSWKKITIPYTYRAGQDFKIRLNHILTGSGTNNGSTIDVSAYLQADNAASADLVTTTAQNMAATITASDFVVTGTTLTPGAVLNAKITTTVIESGGAATITGVIAEAGILPDLLY